MAGRVDLIYHETQQAALCGVHAVNALLQAPHFRCAPRLQPSLACRCAAARRSPAVRVSLCPTHACRRSSHRVRSEVEMAAIAAELDAAERALMASGGLESADYLQ